MIKELLSETQGRMAKTVHAFELDLRSVRTGRASPALVVRVMVDYYGTPTPLNQLSVISAPEPNLLVVRPYDPSSLGAIEKAILQADLGFNPSNDGRIIRIPVPRLTEDAAGRWSSKSVGGLRNHASLCGTSAEMHWRTCVSTRARVSSLRTISAAVRINFRI